MSASLPSPDAILRVVRVRKVGGGRFEETEIELVSPRVPPPFDGFEAIQITDTHFKQRTRFAPALLDYIAAEHPDAWFFTGDLLESRGGLPTARDAVARARSAFGSFMVLGNNDLRVWRRHETLLDELTSAGSVILNNAAFPLTRSGDTLWLIGTNDPSRDRDDMAQATADVPDGVFRLLLAHSVDVADVAPRFGIDLLVCGHSHGGQICLPGIGPLISGATRVHGRRFARGAHRFGDMWAYVCRGLGVSVLPVRVFSPREIVRLRLVCSP